MHKLLEHLKDFGSPRIALVGDFMLDRYLYGNAERISPEAPVPVLKIVREEMRLGGAGSAAAALTALGAKAGKPQEQVWLFDGDGSFQMTIQELGTAVQENLAVKIAILNNCYLGMVRQWQELFYGRRYVATPLSGPNFVKIAESYGMPGVAVSHREDVVPALEQAMRHDGPFLIDLDIEPEENVFPMVPPGAAVAEFMEEPVKEKVLWPRRSTP